MAHAQDNINIAWPGTGDLVLVVGSERKQLRVSSQCLAEASSTFERMLKPGLLESMQLRQGEYVLLPADNAPAFEIICKIIHGRSDLVPRSFPPQILVNIATAAEKYGCSSAIAPASKVWLSPVNTTDLRRLEKLLEAAYVFQDEECYAAIANALVLTNSASFQSMPERTPSLPIRTATWLEELRSQKRMDVQDMLVAGQNCDRCTYDCDWTQRNRFFYTEALRRTGLFPNSLRDTSLNEVIRKIDNMGDIPIAPDDKACPNAHSHKPPRYRVDRDWRMRSVREAKPVCLDCVRTGKDIVVVESWCDHENCATGGQQI